MEIRDYLRAHRRRALALLLLPVVAGGTTAGLAAAEPVSYQSSAIVTLPAPVVDSAGALLRFSEDFEQSLTSPAVLDAAAAATGLDRRGLREGLQARRQGNGGRLKVTLVGDAPDALRTAVDVAGRATLAALARPGVDVARAALEPVQQRYDEAVTRRDELVSRSGVITPEQRFQALTNEIDGLDASVDEAVSQGFGARAAAIRATAIRRTEELEALRPVVREFQALDAAVVAARGPLSRAQEDLREAEVVLAGSTIPTAVSDVDALALPRTETVVRPAVVTAGLALFLGVALLALLDLVRATGRGRHTLGPADPPVAGAAPADPPPAQRPTRRRRASTAAPAAAAAAEDRA